MGAQLPRPPHPKRVFLSLLHVCFAFSSFYLPVLPGGGGAAARARDGTPSRALGSGPAPSPGGGGAQINTLTGQHRCWWGLWSLAAMGWVPPLHPFCAAVGAPIPASRNSLRAFTSPSSPLLSRCPPPPALLSFYPLCYPLVPPRALSVSSHLHATASHCPLPPPPQPSGSSGFACGFYCASVASHVWGSGGARPGPPSSRFPAPGPPHWPLPSSPGRAVRPVRCIPSTGSCKRPWGGGSGWAPGGLL